MMLGRKYLLPTCCGLFVATSALMDWYLNTDLYNGPLSAKELWHYELFGIRPRRVLLPPDPVGEWWLVLLVFLTMFFIGFMLAKLSREIHATWRKAINNAYLKVVALAALLYGACHGIVFAYVAFMLPVFWRFYLSLALTVIAGLGFFLVLRSPSDLYCAWRRKTSCS